MKTNSEENWHQYLALVNYSWEKFILELSN